MEKEERKPDWKPFIIFVLSILVGVEVWNHTRAGQYRAWLMTDDELARLTARELTLQAQVQDVARGEEMDERMARIAVQQEKDAKRKLH